MKKVLKNGTSFIKKNYKFLLYSLFILLIDLFAIHAKHGSKSTSNIFYITLLLVNAVLIVLYSIIFLKYEKLKIEKFYLMIIIPVGLMFLVFFPPSTIPDENSHLLRAIEISEGHLLSTKIKGNQGRAFDVNVGKVVTTQNYREVFKNMKLKKSGDKKVYWFGNTALYAFVCYFPQVIGVLIAKMLSLPLIFYTYLGRFVNFLVFVFLSYQALKLLPCRKATLFFILLFPIVIQESVSLSPDALTIGLTAFFVSYIMHLRSVDKELGKREIAILSISSIVLSLCKIVYLPLCFLVFLIPKRCFKSLKKKNITLATIMIVAVIINILWLSFSSGFLPSDANFDSSKQLNYIIGNIPRYIGVMSKTFFNYYQDYMYGSVGSILGRFEVYLAKLPIDIFVILFIFVLFFDNNDLKKKDKLNFIEGSYVFLVIFAIIMLINTSLYLQWTPLKNDIILGIQGRYFIPLYIPAMFLFSKYGISPKVNFANKYIFLFITAINIYAASSILYYFI